MRYAIVALLLCGCAWGQATMYPVKVDVPAKKEPAKSEPYMSGDMLSCSNGGSIVMGKDGFPESTGIGSGIMSGTGWKCEGGHVMGCSFDPDRIIIGPDGHGNYWCHLPQTGTQ